MVIDAHLDAIYGAGMLDNASGSATILDIARMMKNVNPLNHLRFIWFGGEEIGLLGSKYYVDNLSPSELSHIGYDLDADVTATPNYTIGVLDPAGPDLFTGTVLADLPEPRLQGVDGRTGSDDLVLRLDRAQPRAVLAGWNRRDQLQRRWNPRQRRADGTGLLQDPGRGQPVRRYLGNFEGNLGTFDGGCVDNPFRWCDNLSNNDPNVLEFMSKGFANAVVQMAFDNKVMSASNNVVIKPKLPMADEVSRHFPAK